MQRVRREVVDKRRESVSQSTAKPATVDFDWTGWGLSREEVYMSFQRKEVCMYMYERKVNVAAGSSPDSTPTLAKESERRYRQRRKKESKDKRRQMIYNAGEEEEEAERKRSVKHISTTDMMDGLVINTQSYSSIDLFAYPDSCQTSHSLARDHDHDHVRVSCLYIIPKYYTHWSTAIHSLQRGRRPGDILKRSGAARRQRRLIFSPPRINQSNGHWTS